ncbi:MAG TPA: HD domain-containing protein [Epulopiscium sp.]|nr:HD domain-containing protein [Candidatus Epulonipiscium sp.]
MKRVLIDSLEGGEILAQDVWDHKGAQWLAEGTTYKISYLNKLHSLGISHIYIKEKKISTDLGIKKDFNPDNLIDESKAIAAMQLKRFHKSGSVNIYKYEKLVFDIMNEVMGNSEILETIYDMKGYDYYTYEHSVNVTVIAIMISQEMELSRYQTYEIAMGCLLHDLGKMQISEEILNKPSTLTIEEFVEIKKHSINGYNIVKNNKHLSKEIKETILTHHEKLDGSGYPLGISGDQIQMGARICSLADVFDAMCSKRPYKMAVPFAESLRIIKMSMSKQLDMAICHVLEKVLK